MIELRNLSEKGVCVKISLLPPGGNFIFCANLLTTLVSIYVVQFAVDVHLNDKYSDRTRVRRAAQFASFHR